MEHLFKEPLCGIIPPLVTPLLDNDTLDINGLERLVERLIKGGVHGLFVLGTTGESQSLSYQLRQKMIQETSRINAGRLPLLVGVSDTSLTESIALAHFAANCNADAVVSAAPYYYAPSQTELVDFYEKLIERLPLPLFLYNMPSHVKVNFAPETIGRLAQYPEVVGFKDSSANAVYFQNVMQAVKEHPNFSMLVGPEEITAECVWMGAHGGVNGGANMFPELYVKMYNAAKACDLSTLRQLQPIIMQISRSVYNISPAGSSYLCGLKCALSLLGVCSDYVATPFHPFGSTERALVRHALEELPFKLSLTE